MLLNYQIIINTFSEIKTNWQTAFKNKRFAAKVILLPIVFWIYSIITQQIGTVIESRQGIQLINKILLSIPKYDFSIAIFTLLYGCMALILISNIKNPYNIIMIAEMHLYVAVVRQICILLVPLEAPLGIIPLTDVLLENTFYPPGTPLTKDLFFSGHVASIWIYFLCTQVSSHRFVFFIGTLLMSFMVLSMRIHYTYDVIGAILATTIIYFVHGHFFYKRKAEYEMTAGFIGKKGVENTRLD